MERETIKKLMIKAFKKGQDTPECEDYLMEVWVEDEIHAEEQDAN